MVNSNTVGMAHGVAVLALVAMVMWRAAVGLGWVMKDKSDEDKKLTAGMNWLLLVLAVVVLATGSWFGYSLMNKETSTFLSW